MGGLAHIHAGGVLHLDIKPDNILIQFESGCQSLSNLTVDDRAILKIGDFGHAKLGGTCELGEEGDSRYMAPEFLNFDFTTSQLPLQEICLDNSNNFCLPEKRKFKKKKTSYQPIEKENKSPPSPGFACDIFSMGLVFLELSTSL